MLSSQLDRLPGAAAGTHSLRSCLLPNLIENLPRERRVAILDLGPARQANIDCFEAFSLRYCCWDIGEELQALRALRLSPAAARRLSRAEREAREAELATRQSELIDSMLRVPGTREWDLVLSWEIFNYLDRPVLSLFLQRLVQDMRRGGRIHALVWGQGRVPQQRVDVGLSAGYELVRDAPADEVFVEGGYTQYQLRGLCEGLVVHKGILLRNGLQELNLSYRGSA